MAPKYLQRPAQRQGLHCVAAAGCCRGAKQGVVNGLFGRFDDGKKQRRHRIVRQDFEIAWQISRRWFA